MITFFQVLIAGLETGSLYALSAMGLILVFRTSQLLNFAHRDSAMFCTFIALAIFNVTGSYPLAFIGAVVFGMVLGLIIELITRVAGKINPTSKMIVTLGLAMVIGGLASSIFGLDTHFFRKAIMRDNFNIAGVIVQPNSLFIMLLSVVIMAILLYIIGRTKIGVAIRATAQNELTAKLMGVPVDKIYSFTWITAVALAAITGILVAPVTNISIGMMGEVHMKAFTAAVLGGFGSFVGPVVGGLLVGVLDNMVGLYISLTWKTVIVYAFLILILIIRPAGLFGSVRRKKV